MSCSEISLSSDPKSLQVHFDTKSTKLRLNEKILKPHEHKRAYKPPKQLCKQIKPKYFSKRSGITESNQRDVFQEPSPFRYPKDTDALAHKVMTKSWRTELRSKELAYKYNERHNYKTRQQADLIKRLFVSEAEVKSSKMITDIDPEFYSVVEGRPIKSKLRLREYVETVRNVLRTKILIGYRGDDIMLLNENLITEQKEIDQIRSNHLKYVNSFEEFLFYDHTDSMNLLKKSDCEAQLAQDTYDLFRQLSKEYGALRSVVYSTEEKWRNCKLYQRFLYLVSPMSWRRENDYYFIQQDEGAALKEGVSEIFSKYKANVDESSSLEDLLIAFREDCKTQKPPVLYFTDPNQLLDVFRFMELQNLNSLLHSEELALPLELVKEGMARADMLFNIEITYLQEAIDKLAGGISWEEERAKYLEELAMELVNGEFRNLVVADDVLNLHVFVEDVYETRIGPNDANLSIGEMMKMVEAKFREELINLDQMPSEQVAEIESKCYREEAKMIKEAQIAARHLFEFEILYQKMQKVFAPPHRRTTRELKWRSPPYNPPKPQPPPPRSLTEHEKEYLEFFTEYCKFTDQLENYGIDTVQKVVEENKVPEIKSEAVIDENEPDKE